MRKDGESSLLPIDPEIEKTCKQNRRAKKTQSTMAEPAPERPLMEYVQPTVQGYRSAIKNPSVEGNRSFEIKLGMINMVQQNQFSGAPNEDPNEHIANFNELCDTFQIHNISTDAIRLRLFPFSLRDRAKSWLKSLPADSIESWEDLCNVFFAKFFPFEKTARLRNEIHSFGQWDGESLHEAWARFKEMLRKCPHHGVTLPIQLQIFYYGLLSSTKTLVNTAAGGTVLTKTPTEFQELLNELARGNDQCPVEKRIMKPPPTSANATTSTPDVEAIRAVTAELAELKKQLKEMQATTHAMHSAPEPCFWCNGPHFTDDCPNANECQADNANFVGNYNRPTFQNSNNYYSGARNNHPNLA